MSNFGYGPHPLLIMILCYSHSRKLTTSAITPVTTIPAITSTGPLPLCTPSSSTCFPPSLPPTEMQPFYLTHIRGNISKYYGCGPSYNKPAIEPYNLCIQHKEMRTFYVAGSPLSWQWMDNSYYHLSRRCINFNWPRFKAEEILILYLKLPVP